MSDSRLLYYLIRDSIYLYISYIPSTLGDEGAHRHKTERNFIKTGYNRLISSFYKFKTGHSPLMPLGHPSFLFLFWRMYLWCSLGFKVLFSFLPWGLESEVTFAHDIPNKQVHEYY